MKLINIAFIMPLAISQSIMKDIDNVCKGFPYSADNAWTVSQQLSWERQGRSLVPNIEEVNSFCQQSGYRVNAK